MRFETKLAAIGVVLALSSATFAVVMVSDSDRPARVFGESHLALFARPNSTARTGLASWLKPSVDPPFSGVDMTTTGSIRERASTTTTTNGDGARKPTGAVRGFAVGGDLNGELVVLTPRGAVSARIGVDLGEGGVVTAISATRAGWRVETTRGVIETPR